MENNTYLLVEWPESQEFMEEPWFFDEAVLHPDLSSAYFIPENRILNNDYILQKSIELASNLNASEDLEDELLAEWEEGVPFEGGMTVFESVLNLKLVTN